MICTCTRGMSIPKYAHQNHLYVVSLLDHRCVPHELVPDCWQSVSHRNLVPDNQFDVCNSAAVSPLEPSSAGLSMVGRYFHCCMCRAVVNTL